MAKEFVKKPVMVEKSRCTEQLLRDIKKTDTSKMSKRDRLVVENTKFVVTVANQYQGLGVEVEDLVQIGLEAMIRAAEKFDESRDVHFISYAVHDIRNAMLRAINRYAYAVRLPMDVPLQDVEMTGLNAARELADTSDESGGFMRAKVTRLLARLDERERDVIIWSFGLAGQTLSTGERYTGKERLQSEIAAEMHLTMESVRLIKQRALEKMAIRDR